MCDELAPERMASGAIIPYTFVTVMMDVTGGPSRTVVPFGDTT